MMRAEPLLSVDRVGNDEPGHPRSALRAGYWEPCRSVQVDADANPQTRRSLLRRERTPIALVVGSCALCLALVVIESRLPTGHEPLRLAVAALIGVLVTAFHRRRAQEPQAHVMQHAQILLCVSGAMMMVLIDDSLPRAFGIAGAASIIRFRTPVDDPRDAAVLFLLMALGMASGLGAFALAGAGTAMLCLFLLSLDRFATSETRSLLVELVAAGSLFPADHVQGAFARHRVAVELREMSYGETATAKYLVTCASSTSLEALNAELMAGEPGRLRAIAWEPARKKQL
jgi:hypothetical protein